MTGSETISKVFKECNDIGRPAFVGFMTAGYPTIDEFIPTLLAMQAGGVDLIEVGVPFSDPIAEGIVIQNSSEVAIKNGIDSIDKCLDLVKKAKEAGVKVPMLLMGYSNPFCIYGEEKLVLNCKAAGICGFIIVDLPPEESVTFRQLAKREGLSYVPLVTPTTTPQRLSLLIQAADSFIYCISVTGVTGAREQVSSRVPELVKSIKTRTNIPVAVGFGISNNQQFTEVGKHADGVVIGSALIRNLSSTKENRLAKFEEYVKEVCGFDNRSKAEGIVKEVHQVIPSEINNLPDTPPQGYFGSFGGRFVPETLTAALDELRQTYEKVKSDPTFWEEFRSYYPFMGRPSNLHLAQRLTEHANGARIWLKREDLNHTGAHKINNAIAQALVAKRLGKRRIIAETGAGQHGVATATVCAKLGLELIVYMGEEDCERQALNVFRMKLLGATVVPVTAGSQTLKDAINEAMRDWVTNIHTTHYLVGSAIGPDPFPEMVRDFQSVIGQEIKEQMLKQMGKLPDAVVACVGGGSNAIGTFYPFVEDKQVRLIGAEAAGDGVGTGHHSATLSAGSPGILHGTRTYLLQDERTGQVTPTHSISAGLDYPGVGPEHAWLKDTGRAEYYPVDDKQCLRGFMLLTRLEGIIPALESAHAVYQAVEVAKTLSADKDIVICVSGRGDKDVYTLQAKLPEFGIDPATYFNNKDTIQQINDCFGCIVLFE